MSMAALREAVKVGEITDQHLKDIRDTFNLLDTDHDGKLTKSELAKLLRYTGSLKSEAEMEEILAPIDTDHNGSIDYDEFKKYIIEKGILKSLADEVCYEMQDAFNVFDRDKNGYIDKEELKRVLTQNSANTWATRRNGEKWNINIIATEDTMYRSGVSTFLTRTTKVANRTSMV
ncbi:CALMF-like protein [Mya arenaria]|uniref:CALMF-like protein n=1 Tax=Mya arenaria TaxID=6604 RepID=A0ABY7F353_MYAAR|nr:CALMF-like protein [Mya arenaria]